MNNQKTGFTNNSCYLSFSNDCSKKSSDEHDIPRGLQQEILNHGGVLFIKGAAWLETEKIHKLESPNIKSKILCTKHNNLFSHLDAEIITFFKTIRDIEAVKSKRIPVNGSNLELALLKILCGILVSKNLNIKATPIATNDLELSWKKILLNEMKWFNTWGIYLADQTYFPANRFEISPLWDDSSKKLTGANFGIGGLYLILVLDKSLIRQIQINQFNEPLYRQKEIFLNKNKFNERIISLTWNR